MNDEEANTLARQARQQERLSTAQHQLDADLVALMRTGAGRRFVWYLVMHLCALDSVNAEPTDFLRGVELGRRSIGKEVMTHAQRVAPDEWWATLQELRAQLLEQKAEDRKRGAETKE